MTDAWHGSHAPSRFWRGGLWALELRDDELADVTFDGRRVLRSIRAVVRDRDWNTAPWVIERVDETESTLEVLLHTEGFGASCTGQCASTPRDDLLVVSFDAVSATAFETNRTGLVVLHPPQLAGSPLEIAHSDGSTEQAAYPIDISPHQPAFDIAGLSWRDDGLDIESASRATRSRWKTSATGRMPRTRRTPVRSRCPSPICSPRETTCGSRSPCASLRRLLGLRAATRTGSCSRTRAPRSRISCSERRRRPIRRRPPMSPSPRLCSWNWTWPRPAGTRRLRGLRHPVARWMCVSSSTPSAPAALGELIGRLGALPVVRVGAFDAACT